MAGRPAVRLRLVEPVAPSTLPSALEDPARRSQVQQLTQELVDVLIEMHDLVDGDPDMEPEEAEDDDGI